MTPEDQYKGMPIWMQQIAQRNLRAVDRSTAQVNQAGQKAITQIPTPTPSSTPIPSPTSTPVPTPISSPFNFTNGSIDTSLGVAPLPPVNTVTAASRIADSTNSNGSSPNPTPNNFSGFVVNPQTPGNGAYKTNPAAYGQTSFQPSQSYQDMEAKRQQRQKDYGWSHANP